jgi:hypothetical protein
MHLIERGGNMRKLVIGETTIDRAQTTTGLKWLDVEAIASVEVSSEDTAFPIENALVPASSKGWRAAMPGSSHIHLRFDSPQTVSNIRLAFNETQYERSQEWAITVSFGSGQNREILRQGWNFSPSSGSVQSRKQDEVYNINLSDVVSLLLWIDPDRGQDRYPATLEKWLLSA